MEILIKTRGLSTPLSTRQHAARRMKAALGRFGHDIRSVTVRLSDINGPRGGLDKLCRVVVHLKNRALVMEELGADAHTVLDALADRLHHTVARHLNKVLKTRHRPVLVQNALAAT